MFLKLHPAETTGDNLCRCERVIARTVVCPFFAVRHQLPEPKLLHKTTGFRLSANANITPLNQTLAEGQMYGQRHLVKNGCQGKLLKRPIEFGPRPPPQSTEQWPRRNIQFQQEEAGTCSIIAGRSANGSNC